MRIGGSNSFTKHTIDNSAPKFDGVDVCDFDVDFDMDFVACGRNYWMAWYENDGSGNFTKHIIDTDWELFDLPFVTCMDGDSCCDIIVTEVSAGTGHLLAYLNPCETYTEEKEYARGNSWLKVPSIVRNGLVNIEYSVGSGGEARIEVVNITGRVVKVLGHYCNQPGVYNAVWDVSEAPHGVYILKLWLEDSPGVTEKVIVIKGK